MALEVIGVILLVNVLLVFDGCERVKLSTFCCHLWEVVLSHLFSGSFKIILSIFITIDRFEFSVFVDGIEEASYSVSDVYELLDDIWVDVCVIF